MIIELLNLKTYEKYVVKLEGWLQVSVHMGDITDEKVEAITNAANSYLRVSFILFSFLQHGGGLAGAIVKKCGYIVQQESDKIIRENKEIYEG